MTETTVVLDGMFFDVVKFTKEQPIGFGKDAWDQRAGPPFQSVLATSVLFPNVGYDLTTDIDVQFRFQRFMNLVDNSILFEPWRWSLSVKAGYVKEDKREGKEMEEDRGSVQVHASVELVSSFKNRNKLFEKNVLKRKKSNSSFAHPGKLHAWTWTWTHAFSGGVEVTVMIVVRAFVENGHCPTVLPSAAIQHSRSQRSTLPQPDQQGVQGAKVARIASSGFFELYHGNR
ncbi:hypothetical protein T11_4369 [Trichinella zimbabwensis]|uniref:Uncharacterized protein n=1 Tax=Trichinella zimbabwensis TaxID=268475 RepID=A0A0V1GZ68_9BILA|nr:hypothetical protein T11_4369 [Trichinella zimbabwensis]